ncbi:unnamed protein product [Boreogadus saida]
MYCNGPRLGSPNARQQFKCVFDGDEQRLVNAECQPGRCRDQEGGVEGQRHGIGRRSGQEQRGTDRGHSPGSQGQRAGLFLIALCILGHRLKWLGCPREIHELHTEPAHEGSI